jgi:hypothetical protein
MVWDGRDIVDARGSLPQAVCASLGSAGVCVAAHEREVVKGPLTVHCTVTSRALKSVPVILTGS